MRCCGCGESRLVVNAAEKREETGLKRGDERQDSSITGVQHREREREREREKEQRAEWTTMMDGPVPPGRLSSSRAGGHLPRSR